MLPALAFVLAVAPQLSSAELVARPAPPPGETVLDGVVASMEPEGAAPRFVLRGDLVLLLRAEMVMRGAPDPLVGEFHPTVVWGVLEQLVGEQLAVREAERAGMSEVTPEQLASMRVWMLRRLGGDAGLASLLEATGAGEQEFDALLRRRVVAERLLRARRAEGTDPDEATLRQTWERVRHPAEEGGASARDAALRAELGDEVERWESSREALRVDAVRYGAAGSLRAWVRALGSRVRLRVFRATRPAASGG
ncbi:MAG: hypothetical protein R3A52_19915 [Polyangiales bacterium]